MLLLFSSVSAYSQFEYYKPESDSKSHIFGDKMLSVSPNILFNTPNGVQVAGGIKFKIFLSKRISLDTDLVFGRDYFHGGPGLIAIPFWLLQTSGSPFATDEFDFNGFFFVLAATVLSFEHISYHIPAKGNLDISPYMSLLRFKYAQKYGNYSDPDVTGEQLSYALGVELNKYFGRFVLSPYTEFNMGYKDHIPGFNLGVYCGIYFLKK
jgi:hypothetical protein